MTNRNSSEIRICSSLLPLLFLLVSAACSLPGIIPNQDAPSSNASEESSEDAVPTINSSEATSIMVIPVSAQFEVIGDIASLRIGPGIEYRGVGQVSAGDIVTINGMVTDGTWYRLEAQEETWISADFVSSVVDPETTEADLTSVLPTTAAVDTPTSTSTPQPTATTAVSQPVDRPEEICAGLPANWVVYTVQAGDTLFNLSSLTGSSVDEVMRANCMEDPALAAGQPLWLPRLPVAAAAPDTPSPMPSASPPAVLIETPTSLPTSPAVDLTAIAIHTPTTSPISTRRTGQVSMPTTLPLSP